MKLFFWNARGIANLHTRLILKNFCVKRKPDFIFIAEPWINVSNLPPTYRKDLGLKFFAMNVRCS